MESGFRYLKKRIYVLSTKYRTCTQPVPRTDSDKKNRSLAENSGKILVFTGNREHCYHHTDSLGLWLQNCQKSVPQDTLSFLNRELSKCGLLKVCEFHKIRHSQHVLHKSKVPIILVGT